MPDDVVDHSPHPSHEHSKAGNDIWRDSPLRFAGYTNEVGEAFRPLIAPRLVLGSYAVSVAYVLGDTYDKAALAGRQARAQGLNPTPLVMTSALDVLSWQSIASVAAPGLIINRAVAIAGAALRAVGRQPGWAPTIIGLAAIPLIVKPIDALTDALLDRSLRPAIEEYYRRRGKRD